MLDTTLEGGFADPVMEAQAVFRAVLNALANPGTVQKLVTAHSIAGNTSPQMVSVLLALSDHDTPILLSGALAGDEALGSLLRFHTGAPLDARPGDASFAAIPSSDDLPPLASFALGTQEYPDRSTTVLLVVPSLEGGRELVLSGPGIRDHRHVNPQGLSGDFLEQWTANGALFPRGVDVLLIGPEGVMGLPRTTRISEGH
jgi:alpha-D-ribose 1-methylphosphonate 5-triphosphate synthase subunit PhnH